MLLPNEPPNVPGETPLELLPATPELLPEEPKVSPIGPALFIGDEPSPFGMAAFMAEVTSTTSMSELDASCDRWRSSDDGITKSSVYVFPIGPLTVKALVPASFNASTEVVVQLLPVRSYLFITRPVSFILSLFGWVELESHFFWKIVNSDNKCNAHGA